MPFGPMAGPGRRCRAAEGKSTARAGATVGGSGTLDGAPAVGTTGTLSTGGVSAGGTSPGGLATGGTSTGGIASAGGSSTGGICTGGASTGGAATGGTSAGGIATGGVSTGGVATGGGAGVSTGGVTTGGVAMGGTTTGGTTTGGSTGSAAGGFATGGAAGLSLGSGAGTDSTGRGFGAGGGWSQPWPGDAPSPSPGTGSTGWGTEGGSISGSSTGLPDWSVATPPVALGAAGVVAPEPFGVTASVVGANPPRLTPAPESGWSPEAAGAVGPPALWMVSGTEYAATSPSSPACVAPNVTRDVAATANAPHSTLRVTTSRPMFSATMWQPSSRAHSDI